MTDQPISDHAAKLQCLRCRGGLDYKGERKFHQGGRWGVFGDLGELFVAREHYDVYVCRQCGHMEFFANEVGRYFRHQPQSPKDGETERGTA